MKITPLLIISTFHCLSKASGLNTPESKVGDALRPKTDGAESSQSQSHEQIFAKTYDMQSPNHHRRMGSKARKSKAKSKKRHPSNPTHTSSSDDNRDPSTRCEMLAESIGKQSLFERRLEPITASLLLVTAGLGIVGSFAGNFFSWGMNQLGLDFWNDAERDQIDAIREGLDQLSEQLDDISEQIDVLGNVMLGEFQNVLDAITDSQEQIQITIWIAALNRAVNNIFGLWDTYQVNMHLYPSPNLEGLLTAFRNDILRVVPSAIREINEALLGSAVSEGLIPLVARVSFRNSRCIYEYAETMFNLIDYYASVEFLGLYLMIEAYHADNTIQIGAIEQYYNIWQGMVNNQIEMHNSFAPMATVVADREFSVGRVGGVAALTVKDDTAYTLSRAGTLQATSLSGTQMSASTPLDLSGNDRDQVVSFIGAYKDVIIVSSQQMSADPAVVIIQEFTQAGLRPRFSIRREDGSGGAVYATGYDFDVENGLLYILERLRRPGNSDQHKIVTVDVDAMQVMSEVDVDTFSAARGLTIVGSTAVICAQPSELTHRGSMALHNLDTGELLNTIPSSLEISEVTNDGTISTVHIPIGAISVFAERRFSFPIMNRVDTAAVGSFTYTAMAPQGENSITLNANTQDPQDIRAFPVFADDRTVDFQAIYSHDGKLYIAAEQTDGPFAGRGTVVFEVVQTRNVFTFDDFDEFFTVIDN